MDAKRQGEIAVLVIKHLIATNGVKLSRDHQKQLDELAMEIKISSKEMAEFASIFIRDLFEEIFSRV